MSMNLSNAVNTTIGGVEFGFLSSDEIKALSVKRVTVSQTFNSLLHPQNGGLYDAALGSFQNAPCATCRLRTLDGCPGHCGHIELPVRVYHPTYMDQLLRLLRGKCVFCHHFRLPRSTINQYICQLTLLNHNLVKEAKEIEVQVSSIMSQKKQPSGDDSSDDDDADGIIAAQNKFVLSVIKKKKMEGGSTADYTELVLEARKNVIKALMADIGKDRICATCSGRSPTFRKEKTTKIFMKPLTSKKKTHNALNGLKMSNPLALLSQMQKKKKKKPTVPSSNKNTKHAQAHEDEGIADVHVSAGDIADSADEEGGSQAADASEEEEEEDMLQSHAGAEGVMGTNTTTQPASDTFWGANEVHAAMVLLFENEAGILKLVYSPKSKSKMKQLTGDIFFIDTILVPPNRYRPENPGDGAVTEHSRNTLFKAILEQCTTIHQIHQEISGTVNPTNGRRRDEKQLKLTQIELQENVNALIDRNASRFSKSQRQPDGIKQTLEKKEGLFRQNMMGKRVNFAGRSVISPDPNIETNEIGVPPVFAAKLTYPEPVNKHNIWEMRQAVINGEKWPGASAIELEDGKMFSLIGRTKDDRMAIANQLLTPSEQARGGKCKKVHRHLNNGDIVIMNRQPTLHKPSMMCHRTRVLTSERTIRMHYANCNTYNADFDGDEMNMHFPQNELARAEANLIADTDHQYLSSTAGKPLRGLIQDHLSLSVHLTNRDTFFDRENYHQLVYAGLRPENGHTVSGTLQFLAPAILKPKPLWTGKQIVSTVLKNLTPEGRTGLYLESKTTTAGDRWGQGFKQEAEVLFYDGELMYGILDKKQIGPALGGFVHAVYETLGPSTAGRLLSTLGRMLTKLLHMNAFSCGIEDIILTADGNATRVEMLKRAKEIGRETAAKYVSLEAQAPKEDDPELLRRLETVLRDEEKQKGLDEISKAYSAPLSSAITKACLPDGLVKPWPKNQMQLMTGSGAKGTQVNANLISCNLGQQVLEGRRVPTMVSGKTLPCFRPYDSSLRAGGYIQDRFLTGVKPQEYYFHAMAGREGLIDTAVKTSRSGYLQRCLIKGMEALKVEYDTSVRDTADGSVIQFLYGEDGLDTTKSTYINKFKFSAKNFLSLYDAVSAHESYPKIVSEEANKHNKKATKDSKKSKKDIDPATSIWNPASHAGSVSEKFYKSVKDYVDKDKDGLIQSKKNPGGEVTGKAFNILTQMQYVKSLAEPGESVGIVAAQSVGEPSTQMTLNTFHLAGHSSKNVTLGIPRLREIVMTASAKIATPMMTLHLNSDISTEEGERFSKSLQRLSLSEVVEQTKVIENVGKGVSFEQSKFYKVRFDFFPAAEYEEEYNIEVQQVLQTIAEQFLPTLNLVVSKELRKKGSKIKVAADGLAELGKSAGRSTEYAARQRQNNRNERDDQDDSDDDAEDAAAEDEMGLDSAKMRNNQSERDDFDEAQDEEDEELASQASDDEVPDDVEDPEDEPETRKDQDSDDEDDTIRPGRSSGDDKIYISETPEQILRYVNGIKGNQRVSAFEFDPRGMWCEATLEYEADEHKLLMLQLVETCTRNTLIQSIPLIKSAVFVGDNKYTDPVTDAETNEPAVVTEGCNLIYMRRFIEHLNPNKMFTNDIAAMLVHYGVEACRATIVREMDAVFKGHAIDVDNRHLNLIADCMTRSGGYLPFSRNGMKNATSAFMKMSFETTLGVLKEAVAGEELENLKNPSARLVMGTLSKVGTGSFDLLIPNAENGLTNMNDVLKEQM